jgi:hypothetical protein
MRIKSRFSSSYIRSYFHWQCFFLDLGIAYENKMYVQLQVYFVTLSFYLYNTVLMYWQIFFLIRYCFSSRYFHSVLAKQAFIWKVFDNWSVHHLLWVWLFVIFQFQCRLFRVYFTSPVSSKIQQFVLLQSQVQPWLGLCVKVQISCAYHNHLGSHREQNGNTALLIPQLKTPVFFVYSWFI